ncbi:hypothetical protein EYM_03520 [Ignicoccus islandicus DSM 13165]|uniref:Uncharacterized protein n=1 Tax=Ignicoccus islandicus DSM 13165 TaxID=940295 RepID=A0A0U2VEI4_9CREN|nr:hypothetical protein [Ignicoccus islandicus]ALU12418.1 hypothetical protein EYM_03520 [Ignicoccus islandicus DSM 13165]
MGLAFARGVLVLTTLLVIAYSQSLPVDLRNIQEILKNLPSEIIKYRDQLFDFINKNQIYLLASLIVVPLLILLYFDARLIFGILREVTYLLVNRKILLPIEKKWYLWRISLKIIGVVFVSAVMIVLTGWLAWMLQFKNLGDMINALEELRRTQNPLKIIETLLSSLRRH